MLLKQNNNCWKILVDVESTLDDNTCLPGGIVVGLRELDIDVIRLKVRIGKKIIELLSVVLLQHEVCP